MLDRLTRIQLTIFAIVTVLTVSAITIFYLHLPAAVGIGAYKVDANFAAGGGIYENANVTYRGVTVGRVESVGLTGDGIVAHMRLNSGTPVPDNVTATVKSVSAVGEQYIDLVPPRTRRRTSCATARTSGRTARRSARTSPGFSTNRNGWSPASATPASRIYFVKRSRRSTGPAQSLRG